MAFDAYEGFTKIDIAIQIAHFHLRHVYREEQVTFAQLYKEWEEADEMVKRWVSQREHVPK